MPELSRFYGIVIKCTSAITMHHFHAEYAEARAVINIETLDILGGRLPPSALGLVPNGRRSTRTNSGRREDILFNHRTRAGRPGP